MDVQTGLVYVGVVVISAAVILLVSMFGIKEKSYEEAIAEQRKLPHDLLLGKKDKGKEKKPKNKAGKKVKEKKEEKDEKDDKEEKPEHVQFEENPQILPVEPLLRENSKGNKKKGKLEKVKPILVNKDEPLVVVTELSSSQPLWAEANHFDLIQPKDDLELIRSHSKENLHQLNQSELVANVSSKETPTKSKRNAKDAAKQKEENPREEKKEERKETVNLNVPPVATKESGKESNKESGKEGKDTKDGKDAKDSKETKDSKDQQKETPVKDAKETSKESASSNQTSNKESKKSKKKNDIMAQIGGEKDAVDISLLMLFIQKAELSRSEIQILIDQLLNKQLDNPSEHSEWSEGRADPVIKLKKQLAEKEKALADEHEASIAFQNKLKELRAEFTTEKARLTSNARQLEKTLETKVTEVQTLHTRMQHILESHAAEKQGFARQIEQLQSKVNEEAAIIHKMQEDQGQTQGHLEQELIAQRKEMEVQFAQMRENEEALKAQLAQKNQEAQEFEIQLEEVRNNYEYQMDVLADQIHLMRDELMKYETQALHLRKANDRLQELTRQLEESRRAETDLEHRLESAHCHEQELQQQVNSLQAELNLAKAEPNEGSSALKNELVEEAQAEIMKLKTELSTSLNEAKSKAAEIASLKSTLASKDEQLTKYAHEYNISQTATKETDAYAAQFKTLWRAAQKDVDLIREKMVKALEDLEHAKLPTINCRAFPDNVIKDLTQVQTHAEYLQPLEIVASRILNETNTLAIKVKALHSYMSLLGEMDLTIMQLQYENDGLSANANRVPQLLEEIEQLQGEKKLISSKLSLPPPSDDKCHENGIEKTTQDTENNRVDEQTNMICQQITTLKDDLTNKEEQLSQAIAKVDTLKNDVDAQHDLARRLQEDLETQKLKNNELRTRNWKVMEALSAAESRAKSNSGKSMDKIAQEVRLEQEELTKAFLERIFPEIKVSEISHNQWLSTVEEKVQAILTELRRKATIESHPDLIKQNKNLQDMVLHYKQIIEDTESILHKLQNHVESEETRWQSQLQQKENEITSLRVDVSDLIDKLQEMERLQVLVATLQQKIQDLETRLTEAKSHLEQTNSELSEFRSKAKQVFPQVSSNDLAAFEKLQEEKTRLSEELKTEASKRATLDAELLKLRSLVETSESSLTQEKCLVSQLQQEVVQLKSEMSGGCSSSEQSMLNGPPTSDSPKSEPPLAAQTLIVELENSLLKNTEFANCSIAKPINLVQSQQEIDNSPLATKYSSKSCHMTDHNTQASWNPLNGQQHKKHKKKRKSTKKPMAKRRRFAGWFRKKITSKNKVR